MEILISLDRKLHSKLCINWEKRWEATLDKISINLTIKYLIHFYPPNLSMEAKYGALNERKKG